MAEGMGASPCCGVLRTILFVSLFTSPINKGGGGWMGGRRRKEDLLRHKMNV